jgi:chromosome partitioning protein
MGVSFAAGPRQTGVNTIYEVITDKIVAQQTIQQIELPPLGSATGVKMDILPAHLELAAAELELVSMFERERKLSQAITPIINQYAFIIIDCPPSLGLLTINALMTATEVLIPVDAGFFPLIGLGLLQRTVEMVRGANPKLQIRGIIPSLIDHTALARDTHEQLVAAFGERVLPAIPRRVAIGEAHAASQDIFAYDNKGDAAQAYKELLQEVMSRG